MHDQPWNPTNAASNVLLPRKDNSCLPASLVASVPACAVECIQQFVHSHYQDNTCSSTSILSNLCTEENTSGLTIGEGSVQCILSDCTGSNLLSIEVYNICNNIPGSQSKTVPVITATIATPAMTAPAPPAPTIESPALPTSISEPSATQQITSIVMATAAPPTTSSSLQAPTTLSPQNVSTSLEQISASIVTSPTTSRAASSALITKGASSVAPVPENVKPASALDSPQVVGIVLGASAVLLITMAFVFFLCRHRRNSRRRRNKRRSVYAQQAPPPKYDGPSTDDAHLSPPSRNANHLSVHDPSQRFYAGVTEEKRRSFWRRSIRPEDIGLAVSPKAIDQSSPISAASHSSMVKLLPKVPKRIPGQPLWPAPLNVETSRQRQQQTPRPVSEATVFDEDIEAQVASGSDLLVAGTRFTLAPPPKARLSRSRLAPLQLNPFIEEASNGSPTKKPVPRIPLTPTYDNGNVPGSSPRKSSPSSWKTGPVDPAPHDVERSFLSEDDDDGTTNSGLKFLRKKSVVRTPITGASNLSPASLETLKPEVLRKDSETTAATDIEERSTPGEVDRRMETAQGARGISAAITSSGGLTPPQRSPISNLKYPAVPRSAAVSRQAEHAPQPRNSAAAPLELRPPRPTRDTLVRNEASFMVTDSTSSDGYLSDQSIDWPKPPSTQAMSRRAASSNQAAFKTNVSRLRENASGVNVRASRQRPNPSLDQVLKCPFPSKLGTRVQQLPSSSVPATSRGGDLYFTVEM